MQLRNNKVAVLGVFTAVGLLLGYIESLFVIPIKIPGVRIGLSNLIIVLVLYLFGPTSAFLVLIVKVLLSGILFGSGVSLLYSLGGALLSFIFMLIIYKCKYVSVAGVSTVGGVMHNIGQIFVASFLASNYSLLYYIPVLILSGCIAGFIIGILALMLIKRLGNIFVSMNI